MATSFKTEVELSIPKNWEETTEKQRELFFRLAAHDLLPEEVKVMCLFEWNGIEILYRWRTGNYACRQGKKFFFVAPESVAAAVMSHMDWLDETPKRPMRQERIAGKNAVAADFKGVPFEIYIACDNLYQGYLLRQDDSFLLEMARMMYDAPKLKAEKWQLLSVFYWFAGLKELLAQCFKNFYSPMSSVNDGTGNLLDGQKSNAQKVIEAMNAQIRALTKGDITKENEVLALDTWRALTELDAQAKEYQQLKNSTKK